MKPFLTDIAKRLLSEYPKGMDQVAVVLPSRRAIVFLKHYLAQEIEDPIWLPTFYSIEDFIEALSGLKTLDNLSLQFQLYEVYKKHTPKEDLDDLGSFLKWSQTLLYDFNEIDRYLVDAERLLTNLTDLKEMEQWSLGAVDLSPFQEKYVRFFEHMYQWYISFKKKLLEQGFAYQGLAYRLAADKIVTADIRHQKIWFVGLNALTTAEKKIIDHLVQQDKAVLFWDADEHYLSNENHEAGLFLRQHFDRWGAQPTTNFFKEEKNIQLIGCARNVGQTKVAGDILSKISKEELASIEQSETAVVMADEQLLFPVLNNLPKEVEAVNITMGSPLSSTPLFGLIDLLFKLHLHKERYQQKAFYHSDLQRFLHHPYLSRIIDKKMCYELYNTLVRKNIVFANSKSLERLLERKYAESWKQLAPLLKGWEGAKQFSLLIKSFLLRFKEQLIEDKGTVESEVLFAFYTAIQQLENYLEALDETIDLKTLHTIFFQLIGKASIPFRGEPLSGLQLMGVLETRTLDFKNLIVLSVNEEKLPAGKSVNSFLPFVLKKYFKMPTHEERDAVFAYHFYRLLQRASNIHLLYNTQNDDFGSGEKSRFIVQLQEELAHLKPEEKLLQTTFSTEVESEGVQIAKTPLVEAKIKEWAGSKVSPSALNTYVNCSLQFYFQYIARIKEQKEVEEFIDDSVFGTLIHDALEQAYTPYLGVELSEAVLLEVEQEALQLLGKAFKEKYGNSIQHGKNHLVWKVAFKLTQSFFEEERKLLKKLGVRNKTLTIAYLEEELSYEAVVAGVSFSFFGKLDRVDILGDTLRIVDYKTGKVEQADLVVSDWEALIENRKRAKAFQLMTYAYLYLKKHLPDQRKVVAGNYSFKNLSEGLLTIKQPKAAEPLVIDGEVMENFEAVLYQLLHQIVDPKVPFEQTADLDACLYCDFKSICRR